MSIRSDESKCAFGGNPDLYGIGVRVGIYMQWAAQVLVTIWKPSAEPSTLVVKLLLQVAILLSLIIMTANGEAVAVDVLIAFWLLFGPLPSLHLKRLNPFASLYGLPRIAMDTATAAFYCWFWVVGWEKLEPSGCHAVAFFGNVSVDGPFRVFCMVAVIAYLVLCTAMIVIRLVRPKMPHKWWKHKWEEQLDPRVEPSLLVLSVVWSLFSIAVVEYLIKANSVESVNDLQAIGQFIALLTGGFSVLSVLQDPLLLGFGVRRSSSSSNSSISQ
ncbi:hypothetical protein QBC47DRAFT_401548 [Echria macrotheca]|uniref:Uncharacterized protein n=1 Tax=Echria macrotheca TaxID=438768 RepID=A0AAJ0F684_9PEZI|nr:hypothetical protein QBC47DRAFT_401548 [Echria macrotheca]